MGWDMGANEKRGAMGSVAPGLWDHASESRLHLLPRRKAGGIIRGGKMPLERE